MRVFLLMALLLTGCSSLMRSNQSGYAHLDGGEQPNQGRDRKVLERQNTARELGYGPSQDLSSNQEASLEQRLALKRAEKNL